LGRVEVSCLTQNLGFFLEKRSLFSLFLGFDLIWLLFGRVSLGVLVPNFLSEEVWGRESSRVRLSNPKFRVFLRKVRCEPLSLFLGF
jgi:hypothetical protein